MKTYKAIIVSIFLVIAGISAYSQTSTEIGKAAPDFTLTDSYGKSHSLSDFKGKLVVLEWVNFDCPFVVKHYSSDNMQNLQKKYTGKDVVWLSINSSAPGKQGNFTLDEINVRIKERDAKMTAYLVDESGETGKLYGAKTTPHLFIIDKEGNLVYAGAIDDKKSTSQSDIETSKNFVSSALDELLSGKAVSTPSTVPYGCSVKYK